MSAKNSVDEFMNTLGFTSSGRSQDDDDDDSTKKSNYVASTPNTTHLSISLPPEIDATKKKQQQKLKIDSVDKIVKSRANAPRAKPEESQKKVKIGPTKKTSKTEKVIEVDDDDYDNIDYQPYKKKFDDKKFTFSESSDDEEKPTERIDVLAIQMSKFQSDLKNMSDDFDDAKKQMDKMAKKLKELNKEKKQQQQIQIAPTLSRSVAFLDLNYFKKCIRMCESLQQVQQTINTILPRQKRLLCVALGVKKANSLTKQLSDNPDFDTFWKTVPKIEAELLNEEDN